MTARPETHNRDLRNLPRALEPLTAKRRWVVWKWQLKNGKWTKPPLHPEGRRASIDNPETWSSYGEVCAACDRYDGIGYVLSPEEAAFDIDDCRMSDGEFHPWALAMVDQANTYAEVTVSGTGLRIVGLGDGPPVHVKRSVQVPNANGMSCEIYRRAIRYITVSGCQVNEAVARLANIDELVDRTHSQLGLDPQGSQVADDYEDDLERTLRDGGGQRHGPSRSEALWYVINEMLRRGYRRELVERTIMNLPRGNPIADHVADDGGRKYVERQINKATSQIRLTRSDEGKFHQTRANVCVALLKTGVTVRYDEFSDRIMLHGLKDFGPTLSDVAELAVRFRMEAQLGFKPSDKLLHETLLMTARLNSFHPVRDYLDGLVWDGVERIDTWLVDYAGAEDSRYVRAVGALVLVAAVRRIKQPGCKFDELVVLEARQGTDRSTALSTLAVNPDWFNDNLLFDSPAKEAIEQIRGKWIIEAAELSGMRRADVEHMKAFLSRQYDRARLAYDKSVTEAPRQCIIIGTTNASRYLRDTTGNRRFWPVSVSQFDVTRLRRDRNQLWAEAVVREAASQSIRLDQELWGDAADAQEARTVEDPYYDELLDRLGDKMGKISSESVWAILDVRGRKSQDDNLRMIDGMRRVGWERAKSTVSIDGRHSRGFLRGPQPWKTVRAWRDEYGRLRMEVEEDTTPGRPEDMDVLH